MNILLAGADTMEFGWLLMAWIPAVRKAAEKYEKTVIVCDPANEFWYKDFANEFVPVDRTKGNPDCWFANRKPDIISKIPSGIKKRYPGAKIMEPCEKYCMKAQKKFTNYGLAFMNNSIERYDILIHARACDRYGSRNRNWSVDNWNKLIDCTTKRCGSLKIASIGSHDNAYHIPGTVNLIGYHPKNLVVTMSCSRLLIGPSSGPMHLGELCGIDRVVWTDKEPKKILNYRTNRDRYEKIWKPFDAPITVIDNEWWQPSVSTILAEITRRFNGN